MEMLYLGETVEVTEQRQMSSSIVFQDGTAGNVANAKLKPLKNPCVVRTLANGRTVTSSRLSHKHSSDWVTPEVLEHLCTHEFLLDVEYQSTKREEVIVLLSDASPDILVEEGVGFHEAPGKKNFWEGTIRLYAGTGASLPVEICNGELMALISANRSAVCETGEVVLINRIDAVLDLLGYGFRLGRNVPESRTI